MRLVCCPLGHWQAPTRPVKGPSDPVSGSGGGLGAAQTFQTKCFWSLALGARSLGLEVWSLAFRTLQARSSKQAFKRPEGSSFWFTWGSAGRVSLWLLRLA